MLPRIPLDSFLLHLEDSQLHGSAVTPLSVDGFQEKEKVSVVHQRGDSLTLWFAS